MKKNMNSTYKKNIFMEKMTQIHKISKDKKMQISRFLW
jgi:hypothetical protein